jgi:hypothetical protein
MDTLLIGLLDMMVAGMAGARAGVADSLPVPAAGNPSTSPATRK